MHNVNPALPALSRAVEEEIALHNDRSTICAELQEPDLHAGMGLLSIIQKNKYKDREVRILFLGLDNAGKTTTLKRLLHEPIDTISPTFGFSIRTLVRKGFTVNIWDVGGQRTLRPYWRNYFEKTDGVVWVVDSCDLSRMEDCHTELWKLLHEDRLAGASLLVFANKQDVQGAQTTDAIRKSLRLDDIQSHSWRIQASSAVQGLNVDAGMDWLLDDISSRLYYYKEPVPSIADKHRAS